MRQAIFSSVALASLAGLADAFAYGDNQVKTKKDPPELAAAFPEPKNTRLLSPAFLSPESVPEDFAEGKNGPTNDATLDFFLRNLSDSNSWMTYRNADFKSEEGRSFPYVYLSANSKKPGKKGSKLRVWIQAAVHGNEPAGDQSTLALLGKMDANQTWTESLLEKMDFIILPRYNPDGVFYFQRYLATNFDPNRDHIKLARQQTRDIKSLFTSFGPHVAVDMHEYSGTTRYGKNKDMVIAADALFAPAKNLNIDEKIRKMSEELFAKRMGEDQEAAGFRWDPYVTSEEPAVDDIQFDEAGSDAKIGRNAMGLTQSITFLCETRGIGLADQEMVRRTASALQMAVSIIQTAGDNADKVLETVEGAVKRFSESKEDIVITDSSKVMNKKFGMVNATDGKVIKLPVKFSSTTPTKANLTRSRPEAYIIPRAWADLAERLEVSGLEVTPLEYGYSGPVSTFNITSVSFEDEYYEGVIRATVTTKDIKKKEMNLPPGSFWVSTKQKNAALAFVALEPENIDSYASFNIIPLEVGDEYPIFRV